MRYLLETQSGTGVVCSRRIIYPGDTVRGQRVNNVLKGPWEQYQLAMISAAMARGEFIPLDFLDRVMGGKVLPLISRVRAGGAHDQVRNEIDEVFAQEMRTRGETELFRTSHFSAFVMNEARRFHLSK